MREGEREPGGEGPLLCLGSLEVSVGFYRKGQCQGLVQPRKKVNYFSLLDPNELVRDENSKKICNCLSE